MKPHSSWRDGCWKCEDAYPWPHQPNDEAERHYARMERLDSVNPLWDMPATNDTDEENTTVPAPPQTNSKTEAGQ